MISTVAFDRISTVAFDLISKHAIHYRIANDEHPHVPRLGRRVEGRQGVSARQVSVEKVEAAPAAPVAADTPAQQLTPCALRMLS